MLRVRVLRKTVATVRDTDAEALGLRAGMLWTRLLDAECGAAKTRADARRYAINAAAHRAMSRRTLLRKLARRGVSAADAEAIADELARLGILDEAAYARAVVRNEIDRKPAGRVLLMARLRARGVDTVIAKTTVDDAVSAPGYDPRAKAIEFARRKVRTFSRLDPDTAKRRLYGQLARRGFDPETCRAAVDAALGHSDENGPDEPPDDAGSAGRSSLR